jgi:predicted peptidase
MKTINFRNSFPAVLILTAVVALSATGDPAASAASLSNFIDFTMPNPSVGSPLLPGRLYVPPEAASGPRPLILFLHGAGESGLDNTAQVNGNIDNLLAEAKLRGAYLYAPQTNNGWGNATTNGRAMSMIDRAILEQSINANRLYVTGLSMGGGGVWNFLSFYGDRFAAGVPICGVAPMTGFLSSNLLDEPIWAFHARNDGTVNVSNSRNRINGILTAAGEPTPTYPGSGNFQFDAATLDLHYTEYTAGGHGIWPRVYATPAMYDWLFAHAIPEPGSWTLLASAAIPLIAQRRWRGLVRLH